MSASRKQDYRQHKEHQEKKVSLRKQYDIFLAEDQKRKERNAQILQKLDNITQKANQLQCRADHVKSLKWRDQSPPRPSSDQSFHVSPLPLPYGLSAPYTPPRIPPYYYESQKQDLLKPEHSIPKPNIPPQPPVFYQAQYSNFLYAQPPQYINNLIIDDIVKEIGKKYILIPRRTTENPNTEDAHELHPKNERVNDTDISWRDKYDILDKLHNNDDVTINGKSKANNDNKSIIHEHASSFKGNYNEMKPVSNDFEDWKNRLHGKDRENYKEHVKLSKENDISHREVYFADDESNSKIQSNVDADSSLDNSVKEPSHIKDIGKPKDEIKVAKDRVHYTPIVTTGDTIKSSEPLHNTNKPNATPELVSDYNITDANTNLSHNEKLSIESNKTESNEKNKLELRIKENIQTNQVEYVHPNETIIPEDKSNDLTKQEPQQYYQETGYQNPDNIQGYDPNTNYKGETDYGQNESSHHYVEQNQEQYSYTEQPATYQNEHPTTEPAIEQENITSAQEYYDQNVYETQQNETINSEIAYENAIQPSQASGVYTDEDPNGQYAVINSNETFAVDAYQDGPVAEQLYREGTYENQDVPVAEQLYPEGTYENQDGPVAEKLYPGGSYKNQDGPVAEQLYPEGIYEHQGGPVAEQLYPEGTYENQDGPVAEQLYPEGTYENQDGPVAEQLYPGGSYENQDGPVAEQLYPEGIYEHQDGPVAEQLYPEGTYEHHDGPVAEQLYPEGTYENQHLTQEGDNTQNPNELGDNSNYDEQNISYDYNQSEQPQHEYDQTNYQQYESEVQYDQEHLQAYPEVQADVGSVAEVGQQLLVEPDAKALTLPESDITISSDPDMSVQAK